MGALVITCLLLSFFSTALSRETTCWSDVDIVFLLDGSDSISEENFLKEKAFVKSLAALLELGANKSRASVITYSDKAKLDISFGEYSSLQAFQDAVDDLTRSKGRTRLDRALRLAALGAFALGSSPRPGVSKVVVILTNSRQTQTTDSIPLQDAVKPLRDAGVRILVVAIGNGLDPEELDLLIERAEDIFLAPNFDDLRVTAIAIGQRKCETVTPEPELIAEPLCQHRADIAFVMDASSGLSEADFQMEKGFIKAVGSSFYVNSTETRLGLISYSASAHLHVHFEEHDINNFNNIVDAVFRDSKSSRIDQALRLASFELFGADNDDRRLIPKVVVILTDGNQTPDPDAVPLPEAIEPLKQLGVRIFVIAVGNAVNVDEFREIVQRRNHVVAVDGFPDLLRRSRQISRDICDLVIVPPESTCNENADIAFVIDASEGITEQDFQKQKNLVKTIASSFNIGPRETKCGLVAFGNDAKIHIPFMDVSELHTFQEEVERVPFSAGSTQLEVALGLAATQLFIPQAGARSAMPKILIVIGDGNQTSSSGDLSLGEAVTPLVELGVRVYVVAIGNVAKEGQLRQLVQNDQELLVVSDHDDLRKQARYIARRTCEIVNLPPEFICGNYADISFVMDSSLSIRESNFQRQKDFVNIMASSLNVGPEKSHLGVIVFSDEATLSIKFNEHTNLFSFQNAVQSIPYNAGSSRIDKALFVASQELFTPSGGMRLDVNKVLVLITDGKQTLAPDVPPPQIAVDALRQKAVRLYLVGVGDDLDLQWLRQFVQRDQDLMIAHGFKELFNRTRQVAQRTCDLTVTPAEDGMFTEWQDWTTCSRACGYGTRARLRSCSNPPPAYGGQDCLGNPYQTAYCQIKPCPVDGSWSPWRRWGYCSNTCGAGVQRRRRFCTNPPPSNEGKDCVGSQEETRRCETRPCPVDGGWSEWKNWTSCSLTCGTGTLSRVRECTSPPPAFGGRYCRGLGKEVRLCNHIPCPVHGNWSGWGDWVICSTSCGGGSTSRERSCTNPKPMFGGLPCDGASFETKPCNIQPCPVHGNWSEWRNWSKCSESCGGGLIFRRRTCSRPTPKHGGRLCKGESVKTKACNIQPCPVHGNWSGWGDWFECSRSCGGGSMRRQRTCTNPRPQHGGRNCVGDSFEEDACNIQFCPIHGNWSSWGDWFECSRSCGGGSMRRQRTCTNPRPQHGGRQCEGDNFEAKACNIQFCPIHGNWSDWGVWFECSTSCGGGSTRRVRTCTNPKPEYGGRPCEGELFETKLCNNQSCPIHGNWSEWGDWFECSESCGGGSTRRQRTCTRPTPKHGGRPCEGETFQTKTCNSRSCPINGNWTAWGVWVMCSASCGEGSTRRGRSCTNPKPKFGGLPCEGASFEAKPCNIQPCPIHGNWSEWTDWLQCSKSCGRGHMKRERSCTSPEPKHGGQPCQGKSFETKTCNDVACPVHGNWTDWSKWSVCSETCGGGTQRKYRICSNPVPANGGNECSGIGFGLRLCNEKPCPVHGAWSGWSPWSACSKSCDGGTRTRLRSCNSPSPSYGGSCCNGSREETRNCSVQSCPVIRCKEKAYIAVLMDGSGSISKPDFQKQKDFVKDLASRFVDGKLQAELGLISFGQDAHLHARFTDHDNLRGFQDAVEKVPQEKKATRMDKALTLASKHLFTSRGGVLSQLPRVLIVLTSGKQSAAPDAIPLEDAVQPSRGVGVRVFAVAVGNQADPQQLRLLVQRDEDVLQVAGFTDLLEKTDQIVNRICKMIILPPVPLCTEKVDIGFLMDASGSIGELEFQKERDFVKAVASAFNVSASQTQLGLIDYSREANLRIKFGDYRDLASFQAAVDAIPYQGNATRIDKALQLAASGLFNSVAGARVGHMKIMIMLSDGVQTNDPDAIPLKEAVRPLRDLGVKVVAVGVGSHTDPLELEMLVEMESDLFSVTDFADLLNKAHEISKRTCDIAKVRCSRKVNLGFLMDSSSSVGYVNFKTQKEFVKRIAASFRIGPKDKSPGVITYNGGATLHVRLGDHRTISAFQAAVNRIPYLGGATRIDKGLIMAANRLFTPTGGLKLDTPKVLILLTDGQQSPEAFRDPVRTLNLMGVRIIAVGIGSQVDYNGLRFTVEKQDHMFAVDSFDDLLDTAHQVVASSCDEQTGESVPRTAFPTSFTSLDARCPVQADVGFVMATSQSVGSENYIKQKKFLNDLVLSTFYVGMQETRMGMIISNGNATIDIRFDEHNSMKAFNQAVANTTFREGASQLDRAVRLASSRLFTADFGSRSNVPRVLVILSDGSEAVGIGAADLKRAVEPLFNAGIRVLAVGIGVKADPAKLGQLVEKEENVFFVYDFNDLLEKTRDISSLTCGLLQEYQTGGISTNHPVCPNRIDLGFVIDSSSSAGPKDFEKEKELIKSVAIHFDISKPGTRAGVIVYSDNAIVNVRLDQYKSHTAFERAINMLPYFGEGNRKDRALRAANSMFQSRKSRDVLASDSRRRSRVMFLTAEGKETVSPGMKKSRGLRASAKPLHQSGVKVVVLGIGRQASVKELNDIAGDSKNVFMVSSLHQIHRIAETLRRKACELPGEANRQT